MKVISPLFWRLPVAAISGAATTLAFAPFQYWAIAPLSLVILLALLINQSVKHGAFIGYAWGLGLFGAGISWVHVSIDTFGGMPKIASLFLMVLLIGYLALYSALFGGLFNRFNRSRPLLQLLVSGPILWLVLDWLRGWVFTGFPWLWLGYSQIESPLAPIAPVLGVEGLTLAIYLLAASLIAIVISRNWQLMLIPAVIAITSVTLATSQWVTPTAERQADIALIQGNISQEMKWVPSNRWPTLMRYTDLTRENWDADIVIWPEAAIPALEEQLPTFLQNLDSAARNNDTALVTGVLDQEAYREYYNNILVLGVNPDGEYNYQQATRYSKHHLLPFGEFVPFGELLRPIAPFFNLPMSSFSRGDFVQPNLIAKGYALAPALCYEIAFNEQVRQNVDVNTDFLLTLSNDAWFGTSIGPFQHMEIAQMRALELGKPLIRATNNGVTALVDHNGKITEQLPQFETAVLRATLTPTEGLTPYTQWGSIPLYVYMLVMAIIGGYINRPRFLLPRTEY